MLEDYDVTRAANRLSRLKKKNTIKSYKDDIDYNEEFSPTTNRLRAELKNRIMASGLSRIIHHIAESAVGTISAYRVFQSDAYVRFRNEMLECEKRGLSKRSIEGIEPYLRKNQKMSKDISFFDSK